MPRAAILCAGLALFLVLANVVAGAATGLGWLSIRAHALVAIPTSVATLFFWTVVVLYFLHVGGFVREAVGDGGADAAFLREARALRTGILPWVMATVLVLIAAYVIGGGADTGAVPPAVHLALALLALFLHAVAAYRTVIFVGMAMDLERRVVQLQG
jgi:hypothetical protein